MTTFTMRLHTILGVDSPDDADASLIGLDRYPIWDEGYRSELNHKIVMRFWNREIGHETVGMFVHAVRRKMGEIMPYYSQLAETATWEFDPFETINVEHTSDGVTDATGDSSSETTGTETSSSKQDSGSESVSRTVSSEHPQTRLNNHEDYATASQDGESKSANESQATSDGEQTQTGSQNTNQQQHQTGKQTSQGTQGNKSAMLEQYRATLIGVDTMILDELEILFMGVWDTDHSYTTMGSYPLYLF